MTTFEADSNNCCVVCISIRCSSGFDSLVRIRNELPAFSRERAGRTEDMMMRKGSGSGQYDNLTGTPLLIDYPPSQLSHQKRISERPRNCFSGMPFTVISWRGSPMFNPDSWTASLAHSSGNKCHVTSGTFVSSF